MEETGIPSASGNTTPYQGIGAPFLAVSPEKLVTEPHIENESLSTSGTRVNSPDASIHEGKEGHELEEAKDPLDGIDIYDPDRPKFKLARRM